MSIHTDIIKSQCEVHSYAQLTADARILAQVVLEEHRVPNKIFIAPYHYHCLACETARRIMGESQ